MTLSIGSSPGRWNQSGDSSPKSAPEHRVVLDESVVDRDGLDEPAFGQLLVGERDPEATPVVLLGLDAGVRERRVVAEAGDVHTPDVETGVALGHPVGEREADAAALRQSGHHAARRPVVAQTGDGADQRVAVGRERERAVDDRLDAGRRHRRVVLESDAQLGLDAVEVGRQQLHVEVPRRRRARTTAREFCS